MYYVYLLALVVAYFSLDASHVQFKLTQNLENKELINSYMNRCATSLIDTPEAAYKPIREELLQRQLSPNDVNQEDDHGCTPLMYACEHNHYDLVVLFCNANAELITKDNAGKTALMKAAEHSHITIMNYLLEQNPKIVNQSDSLGWSALTYAVVHNACSAIAVLITAGANKNIEDRWEQKLTKLATLKKTLDYLEKSPEELKEIAHSFNVKKHLVLNSPTRSPLLETTEDLPLFAPTYSPISQIDKPLESYDKKASLEQETMTPLQI